jgi:hypothetical protein
MRDASAAYRQRLVKQLSGRMTMADWTKDDLEKIRQDVFEELDKLTDEEFQNVTDAIKANPDIRHSSKAEMQQFIEKAKSRRA